MADLKARRMAKLLDRMMLKAQHQDVECISYGLPSDETCTCGLIADYNELNRWIERMARNSSPVVTIHRAYVAGAGGGSGSYPITIGPPDSDSTKP